MTGLMHQQLPMVMAGDRNLTAFLAGIDELATELYDRIGQKEFLFDPATAPPELVHLPAEWIDVSIDGALPDRLRRRIALAAAKTFGARGTAWSLGENLKALTDDPRVEIDDPGGITVTSPTPGDDSARRRMPRAAAPPPAPDGGADATRRPVTVTLHDLGVATEEMVRQAIRRELRCGVEFTITMPAAAELPPPDDPAPPTELAGPDESATPTEADEEDEQ